MITFDTYLWFIVLSMLGAVFGMVYTTYHLDEIVYDTVGKDGTYDVKINCKLLIVTIGVCAIWPLTVIWILCKWVYKKSHGEKK